MEYPTHPKPGTKEYEWWFRGCNDEARARKEGFTPMTLQVMDCVEVLGQQGKSADAVVVWIATVFRSELSLRQRLSLALRLLRG